MKEIQVIDTVYYSELETVTDRVPTKRGSQRKAIKIDKESTTRNENTTVEPLTIENMVLSSDEGRAHFQRLRYFGCPTLSSKGELDPKKEYINMERDDFIRFMYRLLQPVFTITVHTYFRGLTKYIAFLDKNNLTPIDDDYFHNYLTDAYMEQCGRMVRLGQIKKATWATAKNMLSFVLKALNRTQEAKNLSSIKGRKKDKESTQGLDIDSELKPLLRAYFRAFNGFARCFKDGVTPAIHPIWDEDLFKEQVELQGWTVGEIGRKKGYFKTAMTTRSCPNITWRNQFTRVAAMIAFSFTGQNTTPLLKIQHSDVVFDRRQSGKVYFDMDKARAKELSIDTSLGFSVHAQRFIDTWLEISEQLQKDCKDKWLFPYLKEDGTITTFVTAGAPSVQKHINNRTKHLGLAHATPKILRQTKIDTLMKVTEDIFLVSMSANNSVKTLKGVYSHGQPKDHERNLSASTNAMHSLAKGNNIEDAVNESKAHFHDVLSEYDYKRLREREDNPNESQTPLGVRCQNNKGGAAKQIRRIQEKNGFSTRDEEEFCTDFLECFKCSEHKFVAIVEDIWLMLSFRDTLTEMEQYPTVNSLPEKRYLDLCRDIDDVLVRFREVSEENYNEAQEKQKEASHPLYSSVYSLNDLLEVFA